MGTGVGRRQGLTEERGTGFRDNEVLVKGMVAHERVLVSARILFYLIRNSFGISYQTKKAPLRKHRICPLGYADAKECLKRSFPI